MSYFRGSRDEERGEQYLVSSENLFNIVTADIKRDFIYRSLFLSDVVKNPDGVESMMVSVSNDNFKIIRYSVGI